jgi:hypothetical protein
MAAKLTRLTHKIAIQVRLVAESCTICSSCSRRLVRKLLDTPLHMQFELAQIHKMNIKCKGSVYLPARFNYGMDFN